MTKAAQASSGGASYYRSKGDEYFAQRAGARSDYVQRLRATLFEDVAREDRAILDFGCGNGGIVSRLPAARRLGVEIGELAAAEARKKGVEVHSSLSDLHAASVDVAISFHALEHVDNPLEALNGIRRVLVPGGRVRLVVPCETPMRSKDRNWKPNNDRHLYTWTPLNFGNLAERAGFVKIEAKLKPMPSGSRAARFLGSRSLLGRGWSTYVNLRDNSYNVILDAFAPE